MWIDLKRRFDRFWYTIGLDALVVESFVIEKRDNSWKDTIEYFYDGLIGSMTFNSFDLGLVWLVGVDNLESIKRRALIYQKEELWINTYIRQQKRNKTINKNKQKRSYPLYSDDKPIRFKNKKIR